MAAFLRRLGQVEKLCFAEKLGLGEKLGPVEKLGHYLLNRTVDDGSDGQINDVMRGIMFSYAYSVLEDRFGSRQISKGGEIGASAEKQESYPGFSFSSIEHQTISVCYSNMAASHKPTDTELTVELIGSSSGHCSPVVEKRTNGAEKLFANIPEVTVESTGGQGNSTQTIPVVGVVLGEQNNGSCDGMHSTTTGVENRDNEERNGALRRWFYAVRRNWQKSRRFIRRLDGSISGFFCLCVRGQEGPADIDSAYRAAVLNRASTLIPGIDTRSHL